MDDDINTQYHRLLLEQYLLSKINPQMSPFSPEGRGKLQRALSNQLNLPNNTSKIKQIVLELLYQLNIDSLSDTSTKQSRRVRNMTNYEHTDNLSNEYNRMQYEEKQLELVKRQMGDLWSYKEVSSKLLNKGQPNELANVKDNFFNVSKISQQPFSKSSTPTEHGSNNVVANLINNDTSFDRTEDFIYEESSSDTEEFNYQQSSSALEPPKFHTKNNILSDIKCIKPLECKSNNLINQGNVSSQSFDTSLNENQQNCLNWLQEPTLEVSSSAATEENSQFFNVNVNQSYNTSQRSSPQSGSLSKHGSNNGFTSLTKSDISFDPTEDFVYTDSSTEEFNYSEQFNMAEQNSIQQPVYWTQQQEPYINRQPILPQVQIKKNPSSYCKNKPEIKQPTDLNWKQILLNEQQSNMTEQNSAQPLQFISPSTPEKHQQEQKNGKSGGCKLCCL